MALGLTCMLFVSSLHSLQAQMEREKQQQRQQQLARAAQHSSRLSAAAHKWWLLGSSAATDHLRSVLILSVFGFKVRAAKL
jgi:hypothetical protein